MLLQGPRHLPACAALCLSGLLCLGVAAPAQPWRNCILIGWDGVGRDHLPQNIARNEVPNLMALAADGAYVPINITTGATDTKAGWPQLLSGYAPTKSGAYGLHRYRPMPAGYTVFERLEYHFGPANVITGAIAGHGPRLVGCDPPSREPFETWAERARERGLPVPDDPRVGVEVIGGGTIIEVDGILYVAVPGQPFMHAGRLMELFESGLAKNYRVAERALAILDTYKEQRFFLFVHFGDPDHVGHDYGENSREYDESIIDTDFWTGQIIEKVKALGLYDETLIYITSDHGFDEGRDTHKWAPYIFLATNDRQVLRDGDRADVAPTMLKRLGIDVSSIVPPLDGMPLDEEAAEHASLSWAAWDGRKGRYFRDGVHPGQGVPNTTPFSFKVRYRHPHGSPPTWSRCVIDRLGCDAWDAHKVVEMSQESGDYVRGAIYACSTELPGGVFRYRFDFEAPGLQIVGDPLQYLPGPLLSGRPRLCWTGQSGFGNDGVEPDSGPAGQRFRFRALYSDGMGDPPRIHEVRIRRNGRLYATADMIASPARDYHLGEVFRTTVKLRKPGTYEYRFKFSDDTGPAIGRPTKWRPGPVVIATSPLAITSVAAAATGAGAQITIALALDAEVTVRVLNVAGRPVRTIAVDKAFVAGIQTLVWNRRNDSGSRVPSGPYIIQITARSHDGAQSTRLTTVTLR